METTSGMDMNALLKVTQNTAMSVSGLAEQMGLVVNRVNENTQRIISLEDRMTSHERTEVVNRMEANNIHSAIHERVKHLLGIDGEEEIDEDEYHFISVNYWQGFITALYGDARKHSKLGKPYYATLHIDYEEVMAYIASWFPKRGVKGQKEYLDKRHRAKKMREKKQAA